MVVRSAPGACTSRTRTSAPRCSCSPRSPRPTTSGWSGTRPWASPTWSAVRADVAAVELLFTSLLLQVAQRPVGRRTAAGAPVGVPVVPPLLPARLRPPDRRTAADRQAERHGRGSGRARRRPAPGPAQPPGGGRGAGRRALPARARHPQPGVGRRGRLVRRTRRGRTRRRRSSADLRGSAEATRRRPIRPRTQRFRGSATTRLTSGFCQWPGLAFEHEFDDDTEHSSGSPLAGAGAGDHHRARSGWRRRPRRGCGWWPSSTSAAAGTGWASIPARTGWPGSAACRRSPPASTSGWHGRCAACRRSRRRSAPAGCPTPRCGR